MKEGENYVGRKKNLYGCKIEISVLLVCLAILVSEKYPGRTSDLEMFRRMRLFRENETLKTYFIL